MVIGNLAERDGAERMPGRLRKLVPYFRPYRWQIVTTMALMIFVSLAGLAAPALAQIAIDDGIRKADKAVLVWAVLGLVGTGSSGGSPATARVTCQQPWASACCSIFVVTCSPI